MFIYQNGKLYVRKSGKLVGVNISPTSTTLVKGTETQLSETYLNLTLDEVKLKFNIVEGQSYTFPVTRKTNSKKKNVEIKK